MTSQLCLRVLTTVWFLLVGIQTYKCKQLVDKSILDRNNFKNYGAVSNRPFLSKVIKKIVLLQLLAYLNSHDLLCFSHPAYRPCHSTDTALLKITKHILLALDDGVVSVLTLLGVSSALDTVDRRILFHTLVSLQNFLHRSFVV